MITQSTLIDRFFVYGTLCRGGCRERCWPYSPLAISTGWTLGTLYTRPDYPALLSGPDRVIGECWQFDAGQVADVARVLDQVEGTDQPGVANLYDRRVIDVFDPNTDSGESMQCYAYFYARDPLADGFEKLVPDRRGFVRWPPFTAADQNRR